MLCLFGRPVLGNALPWVEPQVDDVFECLLLEENGVDLCAVIVTLLLHEFL